MRSLTLRWIGDDKGPALAYFCAGAFLCGTALSLLFTLSVSFALVLVVLSTALLAAAKRLGYVGIVLAVICAALSLGILRVFSLPNLSEPFVRYDGKAVVMSARIIRDPEARASGVQATAETLVLNGESVSGVMLLRLPVGSPVSYGDVVSVRGTIKLPEPFLTEEGREFDYENYLRAKGIGAVMHAQHVQVTKAHSFSVVGSLFALKQTFMRQVERTLPEPQSGLLEGMLLGYRDALSEKLNDAFVTSGLVHIVVLSGYNLSLVAEVLLLVALLVLPRTWALATAAGSVVLFAAMAGLDATVLRATLMALIVILGKWLRRPSVIMRSLAVACVAMVAWNPPALLYDPSFVLSFLATFGLVTLSGPIARHLRLIPERFSLREIAAATLATQVFVLPILIFYTGKVSLVALPANLLALPLVPYAMLSGFIASLVGILGSVIALPFASLAWGLLSAVIAIAKFAAAIPFAALTVSSLQTPALLLAYALLGPLAIVLWRREEETKSKTSR